MDSLWVCVLASLALVVGAEWHEQTTFEQWIKIMPSIPSIAGGLSMQIGMGPLMQGTADPFTALYTGESATRTPCIQERVSRGQRRDSLAWEQATQYINKSWCSPHCRICDPTCSSLISGSSSIAPVSDWLCHYLGDRVYTMCIMKSMNQVNVQMES
jgi:hypothetical protein